MQSSDDRGITFMLFVVVSALFALSTALTFLNCRAIIKMEGEDSHSEISRTKASYRVGETAIYPYQISGRSSLLCFTERGGSAGIVLPRTLCAFSAAAPRDNLAAVSADIARNVNSPPLINYSEIFAVMNPCEELSVSVDSLPIRITPSALLAPQTCTAVDPDSEGRFVTGGNIWLGKPALVAAGRREQYFLLAALGYIAAASDLVLHSDTLVVAGGDIYIERVVNSTTSDIRLTIISATGSITLNKVSGPQMHIQAHGRHGVFVSSNIALENNGLPAPELSLEIILKDESR